MQAEDRKATIFSKLRIVAGMAVAAALLPASAQADVIVPHSAAAHSVIVPKPVEQPAPPSPAVPAPAATAPTSIAAPTPGTAPSRRLHRTKRPQLRAHLILQTIQTMGSTNLRATWPASGGGTITTRGG